MFSIIILVNRFSELQSFMIIYRGGWAAKKLDLRQWIQVEFELSYEITSIQTQGRSDYAQWVKSYKVGYSWNGIDWKMYTDGDGIEKVGVKHRLIVFYVFQYNYTT